MVRKLPADITRGDSKESWKEIDLRHGWESDLLISMIFNNFKFAGSSSCSIKDSCLEVIIWFVTLISGQMLLNFAIEERDDDIMDEMVDVILNTKELILNLFDKLIFLCSLLEMNYFIIIPYSSKVLFHIFLFKTK